MNHPTQLEPSGDTGKWAYAVTARWYQRKLTWVALVALLLGGYVALPVAKRRFDHWNGKNRVQRAQTSLEKGDFKHAFLDARAVLESNPQNADANRLIAKALEASGSPTALGWRIRLQSLLPDDAENLFALAKDALDAGDTARAKGALERLKTEETRNATFHELSARLAISRRDLTAAETHLRQACSLSPQDDRLKLRLATIQVVSHKADARTEGRATLEALATNPPNDVPALRVLLADASKNDPPSRIRALADSLVAATGSTFADKLTRLGLLRKLDARESSQYLDQLRASAESNAVDFCQLLAWMNQNNLALIAADWPPTLPDALAAKAQVRLAIAHTYAKAALWQKLRQLTETTTWEELDYMRRAFLARALERLGEAEPGVAEWKKAVSAAQSAADGVARLEQLARAAQSWRWDQRVEDIFWLLTKKPRCPRWVLDALWLIASGRADTSQLQQIAGLTAKVDPGGVTSRNNYTFLCLLTRTQEGDPHRAAKELHDEVPNDAEVALTHALSLYQQGKALDAVAITSGLKPEELRKPGAAVAFYHAVFLIASDRAGEAEEFLQIAGKRVLLPEEKAILLREKEAAEKRVDDARERRARESKDNPVQQ